MFFFDKIVNNETTQRTIDVFTNEIQTKAPRKNQITKKTIVYPSGDTWK